MKLEQGDIVLVKFPFTDLSNYKLRPALVISNDDFNEHNNLMLIGIYGNKGIKKYSIPLENSDLKEGYMKKQSFFRFQNIFSLEKKLILKQVANLKKQPLEKIVNKLDKFIKIK